MSSPLFPSPLSFPLSALSLSSPLFPPLDNTIRFSLLLRRTQSPSSLPREEEEEKRERDGKSRKLFVPKDVSGGGRQAGGWMDERRRVSWF